MDEDAKAMQDEMGRGGISAHAALSARRCKLITLKAFNEPIAAGYARIGNAYAAGGTPDMAALTSVCDRVLREDAGRRVVIFVTDGCGDQKELTAQCVRKYTARGVVIIAVGIGYLPDCPAYPFRAYVSNARDVGGQSMREMLRALLASPATQAIGAE